MHLVGMLKLVLDLIRGLARTESSMGSSEDDGEDESDDLRLHHLSEVEGANGDKSSTSIASKGDVGVKLHLLGNDHSSNTQSNSKDVNEKELAGVTHEDSAEENGRDQEEHVVEDVSGQVDAKTIKELADILGQAVLGVEEVLLGLFEIHDGFFSARKLND